MERLNKLMKEAAEFSDKTFGTPEVRGPLGPLNHLKDEVDNELLVDPNDKMEYADAVLLIFDAARRAGFNCDQVLDAVEEKIEINKNRKWGQPDKNGVIYHVN